MFETNRFTIGITMADGSHCNIDIEPVSFLDYDDNITLTGVYKLYKRQSGSGQHQTFEHRTDNPDYLGDISFHPVHRDKWEYYGKMLSNNEQVQIAERIMQSGDMQN